MFANGQEVKRGMPLTIVCSDIAAMKVDAVVNAANPDLQMEPGVCQDIFRQAGPEKLRNACKSAAPVPVGGAVLTPGFDLPAQYIIHAVGPVDDEPNAGTWAELLRSAYTESLHLAAEHQCGSIAFPLIARGANGDPEGEALETANRAVSDFLSEHEMDVYLVVAEKSAIPVSKDKIREIEDFIDANYDDAQPKASDTINPEPEHSEAGFEKSFPNPPGKHTRGTFFSEIFRRRDDSVLQTMEVREEALMQPAEDALPGDYYSEKLSSGLEDRIEDLDEPFNAVLFRLIDASGRTDAEVYKRANIDRKLFSKIRRQEYLPGKRTILSLAIALELSLDATRDLLERAGYALSHSQKFDVIIEYFIINKKYDIFEINQVLFHYDQPLLGSRG